MKSTDKDLAEWFEYLWQSKAIYVWGANSEKITKKLMDKLYSWFGSKSYPKEYYNAKLEEGEGKIGADCSGADYPISGVDTTADGYYHKCATRGLITKLPRDKVCKVFRYSLTKRKMTHIGTYMGNGYTIEMKSSKDNCVKQKFNPFRWTHYGIPDWITYENPFIEPTETIKLGSKGVGVKWVQWNLIEDGITEVIVNGKKKKLTIDGSCGVITEEGIKVYQIKHGLKVDGKVGPDTRKEMNK